MGKGTKDSEETKRKILGAAKKEFAEKGFSGARMSSIAKRASVNQALLHYHFDSKENLYMSIFHASLGENADEVSNKVRQEINSWDVPLEKELSIGLYILVTAHMASHDDDLNRIFAREIAEEEHGLILDFARKYMMPRLAMFDDMIKRGIQSGIFEISNSLLFTISLISFINDYVHGEEFLKGTKWYKTVYKNKKNTIYNYLIEVSSKTLAPAGKILVIPGLTNEEQVRLDVFMNEIIDIYSIK